MKLLYDNLSVEVSKMTTRAYSTSFSMGIYFLDNSLRDAVYSIYGFVRLADEIVDSFEGFDKKHLLFKFKEETFTAIDSHISLNPILNSFQQAVNKYNIGRELIETFMYSMEMDLEKVEYTPEKYEQYILGSAEVVGLMCLHVFTGGNQAEYERMKPYAMKLGAAFQKVNFLRDLKDDYQLLGRSYFPNVDISEFTCEVKAIIEKEILEDFDMALKGIKMLPSSSKGGVYLAYVYYKTLFNKIQKLPAKRILTERIRINNGRKFGLMLNCMLQSKMNRV
ncbi:phytoene/squalene synthase family protein [Daejeonella sp.]|jgi:phytoene/squalene synthetase|uniref:phytoene/squalene synthase family protein n=1 Tax=Daejeonella sp. TaxID=2805397 RepID=UPI0025BD5AE7|nr:phytoene/squalene synthase family protein [Daejeonella sp.]